MSDPLSQDTLSDAELRRIRILKTIVITLGILIVLGVIGLAAGLVYRANQLGDNTETPPNTEQAPIRDSSTLETLNLPLPAGAKVLQSDLDGALILIRWTEQSGKEHIWVVDLNSGRVIRRIEVFTNE